MESNFDLPFMTLIYMTHHTHTQQLDQAKDESERLKLEISQLKDELKAKNNQLEQLNKVRGISKQN